MNLRLQREEILNDSNDDNTQIYRGCYFINVRKYLKRKYFTKRTVVLEYETIFIT